MYDLNDPNITLNIRLEHIERLSSQTLTRVSSSAKIGESKSYHDFFVLGALHRTIVQGKGFVLLIRERNFVCAAAMLRLQIDTGMRINALKNVADVDGFCKKILDGDKFSRHSDLNGTKLTDFHLRKLLAVDEAWIEQAYEKASDFVHLSGSHFYSAVSKTLDAERIAYLTIGGLDVNMPESKLYNLVDTFFDAHRIALKMVSQHIKG